VCPSQLGRNCEGRCYSQLGDIRSVENDICLVGVHTYTHDNKDNRQGDDREVVVPHNITSIDLSSNR
jgi:hypothetical protein